MKKTKRLAAFALPALLLPLLLSAPAGAQGEMKAGPFEMKPVLKVRSTYQSNIFQTAADEQSDYVTDVYGGLEFSLPGERFSLDFGGWFDWFKYADFTEEDRLDFRLGASFEADLPGWGISLADGYSRRWRPPAERQEAEGGEQYYLNEADFGLDYGNEERFLLAGGWSNHYYDYDDADELDRFENIFSATLSRRVRPAVSALVRYSFTDFSYEEEEGRDNGAHRLLAGISWEAAEKIAGEVRAGYEWKDYNDSAADAEFFLVDLRLLLPLGRRAALEGFLERSPTETDFVDNPYFLSTVVGADFSFCFTPAVCAGAGAGYRLDDYPHEARVDREVGEREDGSRELSVDASWNPHRWLGLELSYDYVRRDSNFERYDYVDHRVALSARGDF